MAAAPVPQNQSTPQPALRLVCLPFAGGGSAVYHAWRKHLPPAIELVRPALPGHDGRLTEPPMTDLLALASWLADELRGIMDRPLVLLGHSMGAWLAFELSRELRRRGFNAPRLLILAACRPPHTASPHSPLHELHEDEFLSALEQRYGGIPAEVKASPELLRMVLPALRADIQMMETYRYGQEPPLDTDILALGGTEDPAVSPAQLDGWRRHTSRACSVRLLPGGHFFLFPERAHRSPIGSQPHTREISPGLRVILARLNQFMSAIDRQPPTAGG